MSGEVLIDNVTPVGDRLNALNELFASLYNPMTTRKLVVKRYWPENFMAGAIHPFIVPIPLDWESAGRSPQQGASAEHGTQIWSLLMVVGSFESGIPTDTAQAQAEQLMGMLKLFYASRKKLSLNGNKLPGLVKAEILRVSGIGTLNSGSKLATVRFPMSVTMIEHPSDLEPEY